MRPTTTGLTAGLGLSLAALAPSVFAQWSSADWKSNQINSTLCQWTEHRIYLLRDTVYIDGGTTIWTAGLNDSRSQAVSDNNRHGIIPTLSLNRTFDVSSSLINTTTFFDLSLSTAPGGPAGLATSLDPVYRSGALLGNDAEFFFYGGWTSSTGLESPPPSDHVLMYQRFAYGPTHTFSAGFQSKSLDDGTTRYALYGAGASVPSEWKAFYFSGLRSEAGPLSGITATNVTNETWSYLANSLIVLETKDNDQNVATWKNETLPNEVQGRAGGELVWVPVGENGVLVTIGGVPTVSWNESDFVIDDSNLQKQSFAAGVSFLNTIDIYDIASGNWYKQNTTNAPTIPLTRGCSTISSAQDASSHNIYFYGGYSGTLENETASDDVWVLSLPSFIWTKVYEGESDHGRMKHQCVQPYPDQLIVVGGATTMKDNCLGKGVIQMFNLSSAQWIDSYDPITYSNYTIPDTVVSAIGGSGTGGATKTTPANGWDDDDLKSIFTTAYDTSKITTYYPYSLATSDNPSSVLPHSPGPKLSKGAIAAIVVCSVIGLTAIIFLALWYYRSTHKRVYEDGTVTSNNSRVMAWIRGTPADALPGKAMTVTTETTATMQGSDAMDATQVPQIHRHFELDAASSSAAPTAIAELPASPDVSEMADTGVSPTGFTSDSASNAGRIDRRGTEGFSSISGTSDRGDDDGNVSPQSPALPGSPTIPEGEGKSYPGSGRRSVFHESRSDLGDVKDKVEEGTKDKEPK